MQSPAPITMTMPILTSWKPGRTITSVPARPVNSAAQRIGCADSRRKITPNSAMKSGKVNEIAVASAIGIRARLPNQPYMATVLSNPRPA